MSDASKGPSQRGLRAFLRERIRAGERNEDVLLALMHGSYPANAPDVDGKYPPTGGFKMHDVRRELRRIPAPTS